MQYELLYDEQGEVRGFLLEGYMEVPLNPSNRHYQKIKEDYENTSEEDRPFTFQFE